MSRLLIYHSNQISNFKNSKDKEMGNFCMGDVGGYGIADYLPRVSFLPKGPVGPAGKKGTRGR